MLVFISGLSGTGKTTIGKAVVKNLNEGDKKNRWIFKDQDDFFIPPKPKVKLSNGKYKSNWDSIDSIDWVSTNRWLSNHIQHNIVLVGFCLRYDRIEYKPNYHIHLSYSENSELMTTRCIDARLQSKGSYLTTPEKIREDQLMVREVIIPFYQETMEHSTVTNRIEVYTDDNNRIGIDVLVDTVRKILEDSKNDMLSPSNTNK